MFRLEFGASSRGSGSPPSPNSMSPPSTTTSTAKKESAILKGHKLSPTAPRYRCPSNDNLLAHRCPSKDNMLVEHTNAMHLAVCVGGPTALAGGAEKKLPQKAETASVRFDVAQRESLLSQELAADSTVSLHLNERLESPEALAALTRTLIAARRLQVLSLAYNGLGERLGALVEAMGAVRRLDLQREPPSIRPPSPKPSGRLGPSGILPELRRLNLTGNALGDTTFGPLAAVLHAGGLPRLTHLELCGNRLTTLAPLVDAATATTDGTTAPDGANGTGNANEADGPRSTPGSLGGEPRPASIPHLLLPRP
eukprot:7052229-Prymnesium_polylepis.1